MRGSSTLVLLRFGRYKLCEGVDGTLGSCVCVECGKTADPHGEGWRAYRGDEPKDEEPLVVVFCPECATREFGGDNRAPNSLL